MSKQNALPGIREGKAFGFVTCAFEEKTHVREPDAH